ncbi:MAG: terminase [Frankiales bacterium]|nr:terminase [Frankiales bacterium]
MPWRGPQYEGELPTLGWYALDWFAEKLVVPDGPLAGEPLYLTNEQAQFVLNFYAIDPDWTGPVVVGAALRNARRIRRAVLSRPKGWGKSPLLAALTLLEACGDVLLDGWDAAGEPVGRSWTSLGFRAQAQVVATAEDQTVNTWTPLLDMCRHENASVVDDYGLEPMETFVGGDRLRIDYVTSAGDTREGFRPVFAVMDQTELWRQSNGGRKLAATVRRNLAKVQGSSVETPNAYVPGEDSVAEKSAKAAQLQREGKLRGAAGILYDHREAPAKTNPENRNSLLRGLAAAYGDSADVAGGWVSLERLVEDFWDPDTEPEDARRFYLNQVWSATDSWLAAPEWRARADLEKAVAKRDVITLGFDGSRGRARGKPDATALIAVRLPDLHMFPVGIWEQPENWPDRKRWEPPEDEINETVEQTMRTYTVVGFYAEPSMWEETVAKWEAKYGPRMKVKATQQHPLRWPKAQMTKVVNALKQLRTAILIGGMTHSGSPAMTRHFLNARRRVTRSGVYISKEHPDSVNKIDAAYAGMLAMQAALDAIAAGVAEKPKSGSVPRRIR